MVINMIKPDIIGTIYKPTGKILVEDGFEYEEQAPIDGYHVNFTGEVPELEEYLASPQPGTPCRMYAGDIMPVCYKFPSAEVWETVWQSLPFNQSETDNL